MGKIRTIKPEFFTSPDTEHASMEARLLFIAMWCWADDYGIGETNLLGLRAFAFPEEDPHLGKEVPSLCKEVADAYGVRFYKVGRRSYYQILTWDSHQKTQRRAKDKNPHYDDPESQVDERFHNRRGTSEHEQGSSEQVQGKCIDGNGNGRGNGRGNGNGTCSTPDADAPVERESSNQSLSQPSNPYPDDFLRFYETYPRRQKKGDALKAFREAKKKATVEKIIEAAGRFRDDPNRVDQFTPLPATWLRADGWEDEPLPDRSNSGQGGSRTFGTHPDDWNFGTPAEDPNVIEGEVLQWPQIEA